MLFRVFLMLSHKLNKCKGNWKIQITPLGCALAVVKRISQFSDASRHEIVVFLDANRLEIVPTPELIWGVVS